MNSTTTTKQTIVESIVSKDYNSGYTYSVSGTGVELQNSGSMIPDAVKKTGTTDGVSYSWTGLRFRYKTNLRTKRKRSSLSTNGKLYGSRTIKCDNNKSNNRSRKHSSNAVNLSKIALLILLSPTSVLANAVSQSNTGSVTNQNL